MGVLPVKQYDVPIISVGNITVGGTGKTPHVEFLVSNLYREYSIGILSRGYKRSTKGFVLANSRSTADTIGDEPMQMYRKFGHRITLAVSENRRIGIQKMLEANPSINLIILDDAFQHRYVAPKISILLMDYSHPFYEDKVLPLGRLRENSSAINRADIIIVTKTPSDLSPLDCRIIRNHLDLMSYQKLFFSSIEYKDLEPVFQDEAKYDVNLSMLDKNDSVLIVSGIANPKNLVKKLNIYPFRLKIIHFPDHHSFNKRDLENIKKAYETMKGMRKIIVTTEKDAVRMADNPYFPFSLKPYCFYLPIEMKMVSEESGHSLLDTLRSSIKSSPGNV